MSLTGKTIGELIELSAITETTLFPVEFSGVTFNIPYSSITTNIKPYKVYTALLTQSGGDNFEGFGSGELTIGVTYIIQQDCATADFTNVGAPNNNEGTFFVATGTTPNSWGDCGGIMLKYNTGAPVVTVLENTIGNIWFTYDGVGIYLANSDNLFTTNKTVTEMLPERYIEEPETIYSYQVYFANPIKIVIMGILDNESADNTLGTYAQNVIEIKVYN